MGIVVRKSPMVVVRPSELVMMADGVSMVKLSPFDMSVDTIPVSIFLLFDHGLTGGEPAALTIRRALSCALVHYYPIAGRVATDAAGRMIQCTGEGVWFVDASANCTIKEAKLPGTLLKELIVGYPGERCGDVDPLLLMQVTEFSCGGFVVGVSSNHIIADGIGLAQFLQAIGELARGLSAPSVVPVRIDDSLPALPPWLVAGQEFATSLELRDYASLQVTLPLSLITRIKDDFSAARSNQQPCTVFEAVLAVLWQCRTRAIISDPDAPALVTFTADVRKYVCAKEGYYGNCFTTVVVLSTTGTVANANIVDLIEMIKCAKERIPDHFNENGGGVGDLQQTTGEKGIGDFVGYNMFDVSYLRNLGFHHADFGGGRPSKVMWEVERSAVPVCVVMSCEAEDGASVWSHCVKEEHADSFLGELARFT